MLALNTWWIYVCDKIYSFSLHVDERLWNTVSLMESELGQSQTMSWCYSPFSIYFVNLKKTPSYQTQSTRHEGEGKICCPSCYHYDVARHQIILLLLKVELLQRVVLWEQEERSKVGSNIEFKSPPKIKVPIQTLSMSLEDVSFVREKEIHHCEGDIIDITNNDKETTHHWGQWLGGRPGERRGTPEPQQQTSAEMDATLFPEALLEAVEGLQSPPVRDWG